MTTALARTVERVSDGDEVYLGGFGYNQPFAVAHELIRQDVSDVRLVRSTGGIILDQLVGAGCVSEAVVSHCWNAIGPAPTHAFRRAVEEGHPVHLQVEEFGLGDLALALFAGARDLPFVPTGTKVGTGQLDANPFLAEKFIRLEHDGEVHHAVSALEPDIGFIHGHVADEHGNVRLHGAQAMIKHGALASEYLVATVEETVSTQTTRSLPERTIVPGFMVDEVVEVPGGSHPSGVLGRYERDVAYLADYADQTSTVEGFEAYLDRWVYGVESRGEYLERLEETGAGEISI